MIRLATSVLAFVTALALAQPATPPAPPTTVQPQRPELPFAGFWQGSIAPESFDLQFTVTFTEGDDDLGGEIDIPAQGLIGQPLDGVAVEESTIRFALAGFPGEPTFEGTLVIGDGDPDRIEGVLRQSGQTVPFSLTRVEGAPQGTARPQEPQPPYPYREEEVVYRNGDLPLAGTLTLPEGDGPFPAVLMISGSGPQDRDGTLVGHRPFKLLADAMTRAGVAVLRLDDRGVGGSGGDLAAADYDDLVDDVLAGVRYLAGRAEIDPDRIGLFGHSEGGYLAPLAVEQSDDEIAFVILMAAPSVSAERILRIQNRLLFELADAPADVVDDQLAFLDALFVAIEERDDARVRELTREQIEEQFAAVPENERPGPEAIAERVKAQQDFYVSPYFRAFVLYDPQPALRRLTVPVLAFYGKHDVQVPAVQNAGPLAGALRYAGNPDVTIRTFERLNHLMQPAPTGAIGEYASIETTLAPEVLELVTEWLQEHVLNAR